MALTKLPNATSLSDGQFIQVEGPDGLLSGFQFDAQQKALYAKESQILFPSRHGLSHVAEDLIPSATCDSPGLLSADDKCKLDALLQTRIGVLGFSGAGFCILPDCRVSMADGTRKPIKMVGAGDVVLTRTGLPKPVNQVFSREIDEDIYQIDCRGHERGGLKLTSDHKVLAVKRNALACIKPEFKKAAGRPCRHNNRNCPGCDYDGLARTTPVWIKAHDIEVGDFIVVKLSSPVQFGQPIIRVADYVNCREEDGQCWPVARSTHICSRKVAAYEVINRVAKHTLPTELQITPDLMKIFGYYLSEGYFGDKTKSVCFAIHVDELADGDVGDDIIKTMRALFGIEPHIDRSDDTKGIALVYNHAILARLIKKLFGSRCKEKRVPRSVMELSPYLQRYLLIGLFRGDCYSRRTYKSKIVSLGLANRELVEQACCLLDRCGGRPSLVGEKKSKNPWAIKNPHKNYPEFVYSYTLTVQANTVPWLWQALGREPYNKPNRFALDSLQGDHLLREVRSVKREHYKGLVYDLNVADEHSYVVNGLVIHNSDDGGFMQGDIILAAGTEFISLERIGNVIRFSVDSGIPFTCACEECITVHWVQDESDVVAIRPPTCSGKLPGVNAYGELKIYLFPEATIVDPANPLPTLNQKNNYPALVFKRYDDALMPGTGEFEMVLKRNAVNLSTTEVGMAFTPGPGGGLGNPELVFFMGLDNEGNLLRFDFDEKLEPGLLGSILYKGHLITKQMAVITDYSATVLSTNQYRLRLWSVLDEEPVGDEFTATNIWRYQNPQNSSSDLVNPKSLVLDSTSADVLPIGLLVDIWAFQVGEVSGSPILRHFFQQPPIPNVFNTWSMVGAVQFGDNVQARGETEPGDGSDDKAAAIEVSGIDDFEPSIWGLTGSDMPFFLFDEVSGGGTDGPGAVVNVQHRAQIDTGLPGLRVVADSGTEPFSQRPVMLWNRIGLGNSMLVRAEIGRPQVSEFSPFDVLLHAPISNYTDQYLKVVDVGEVNGLSFIRIKGAHFKDLPQRGTVRVLTGLAKNNIFNFYNKFMFPTVDDDSVVLAATAGDNVPYPGVVGDVVEFLHREFSAPCVRVEFGVDGSGGVSLQFKVGILGMDLSYENDVSDDVDDFVRGLRPGYAVSGVFTQESGWDGTGVQPVVNADGFAVLDGGLGSDGDEHWNTLELMLRDGQVWVWWNALLIPPSSSLSGALPSPVSISSPYFPVVTGRTYGKFGVRMWPGASIRRVELRTQPRQFSEFTYNNGLTIV